MLENVVYIEDVDTLLRRVRFAHPSYVRPDQTVTSFAFKPRKGEQGLSVDILRLTTFQKSIIDSAEYRLYALSAANVRQVGLDCLHDPLEGNSAHALIVGKFTHAATKSLALLAARVPYGD
jgi:hypothetical protein